MGFKFFSSRRGKMDEASQPESELLHGEAERTALTAALHSLLETLPQSYSGRENIKLLCHAILGATRHLRFVWVGFCQDRSELIKPYAAAGDCAQEAQSWNLPRRCFDPFGPYQQSCPAEGQAFDLEHGLFQPWRANLALCSVSRALAIPLRSEKRGLRGLIVFYADNNDYFKQLGVPPFQAFCHLAEIIWKQSSLMHLATQQAQQDQLTGLMSRRQTMLALEKEIALSEQNGLPLSILICQVEGFDKINALYGCLASDEILAAFSHEMEDRMRAQDRGGRWSGVKFLYLLPRTGAAEAERLAGRLRDHFLAHTVNVRTWSIRLALQVGVATYSRQTMGLDDLVLQAIQDLTPISDEMPLAVL